MSFADALAALDGRGWTEGEQDPGERLAIMLPDGDVAAVDDPHFVEWLLEHGEPAPFGHDGETKLDPGVRDAIRLRARGAATISGFDLPSVLALLERELSPRHDLVAKLTDVLVYPTGGHFERHKDTPVSPAHVGTLIVGLPIAHTGGAFRIDGLAGTDVIDWSGPIHETVRWVALYSDLDHSISPVTSGSRVTLVYELSRSGRVNDNPVYERHVAALRTSALEMPPQGPLMIACAHHVIGLDDPQPQSIDSLRGTDRVIADILVERGIRVAVRTCVVARDSEQDEYRGGDRFRIDDEVHFARLDKPLLEPDIAALLECVTFVEPFGDGGGYFEEDTTNLQPWIIDELPLANWIFRRSAAVTFIRAAGFAEDGFVGNGAMDAYLYKLAALEVTR
jgi:hypothetical protein